MIERRKMMIADEYPFLETPQGQILIMDDKDLYQIMERNISREFAEYIDARIEEVDTEAIYAEELAATDFRCMEMQNEQWHNFMLDVSDELEEVLDHILESKRINKEKIIRTLTSIIENITGEL